MATGIERLGRALELAAVPAGSFWMGSGDGPEEERPRHRVELDAFELGRTAVTNADYAVFLTASGRPPPRAWGEPGFDGPDQPVCGVSWFDAVAFCDWLGALLGRRCHLPTEAQRERAARGGREGQRYPWGDEPPALAGRHARGLSGPQVGFPPPVAEGHPNGFGLYDLGEGVHEWCADWFDAGYYARSPARDPRGPETGLRRASRGGSWRHELKFSRCAARSRLAPGKRFTDYGFRVARSPGFEYR